MTQERFSNLTVLNSHKERTAKSAPPPRPNSKEVASHPSTLKYYYVSTGGKNLMNVLG